jgi:Tol biopolymer transport system component
MRYVRIGVLALAVLLLAGGTPAGAAVGDTTRVSVPNLADQPTLGTQANGQSLQLVVSASGRFIAFDSWATNLVIGDTNTIGGQSVQDVFVYDRQTGETTRVSVPNLADQPTLGSQTNHHSSRPAVSGDARFVAFQSQASNVVLGDTNGYPDTFVHDRQTGETTRVSVPNLADQPTLGTQAYGYSTMPTLSADGRYVAFYSDASNLVLGDTNGYADIFVHDRETGETTRVSVPNLADQPTLGTEANGATQEPSMSADGRFVAFYSPNSVTGTTSNLVLGDTNDATDVFVHDRETGETTRVSVPNLADQPTLGSQANDDSYRAAISADGRFVAFSSWASNLVQADTNALVDVFVYDRQTGATTRVNVPNLANQPTLGTEANDLSEGYPISADGRYVAFGSSASNLVLGDTNGYGDTFVHDRQTGETTRVSVPNLADQPTLGTEANNASGFAPVLIIALAISADGRFAAFHTHATNLVLGDTNGQSDIFVHDRGPSAPVGGIAELPEVAQSSDSGATLPGYSSAASASLYLPLAGGMVALLVITAGAWYARRRGLR